MRTRESESTLWVVRVVRLVVSPEKSWVVWILSEVSFRGVGTVVTPRFRGWNPFLFL
jgi:hypothetical protein